MQKFLSFFSVDHEKPEEKTPLMREKKNATSTIVNNVEKNKEQTRKIIATVDPVSEYQHPKCRISRMQVSEIDYRIYDREAYETKLILADQFSMDFFRDSLEIYNSVIPSNMSAPEYDNLTICWLSPWKDVIRFLNYMVDNNLLIESDKDDLFQQAKSHIPYKSKTLAFTTK